MDSILFLPCCHQNTPTIIHAAAFKTNSLRLLRRTGASPGKHVYTQPPTFRAPNGSRCEPETECVWEQKKKRRRKKEKKRAMAQKMDEAEVTYILTPLQKKTSTTLLTKARRQNNAVFVLSDWFPFLPQLPPIQSNFWHPKCGNNHSFFEVAQAGLHKCSALCADKIQWKTKVKAFDLVWLGECDSCLDVRKSIFYI